MPEQITVKERMSEWASKYPEVQQWLSHAKLQRPIQNIQGLYRFCEWARKTPTELLALKKTNPSENFAEKLLDKFCGTKIEGFPESQKFVASVAVKSFFKHNYASLEKASGNMTLEKSKPYNALSKEGLRKLYNHALNPRDRALIPFVTCTGIAKETLANLLWSHLEQDWEKKDLPCINLGPELLKGHGHGKYKDVRQITFLTPEAKAALKVYKEWVEKKLGRAVMPNEHIWLDTYQEIRDGEKTGIYNPLTYHMFGHAILRLSKESGVPFSLHDGRRWVNTALEGIAISANWAHKIRGRKVRGEEAPYSQPLIEQLREKYRLAVPALEFTSETSSAVEDRLKSLEAFQKSLTPEQREEGRKAGLFARSTDKKKGRKGYKVRTGPKPDDEKPEDCKDGQHCDTDFLQIPEAQLLDHLKVGWKIVKELANGEVIVKRARSPLGIFSKAQ
jgi:integrase